MVLWHIYGSLYIVVSTGDPHIDLVWSKVDRKNSFKMATHINFVPAETLLKLSGPVTFTILAYYYIRLRRT